jgi:hypothetical protein
VGLNLRKPRGRFRSLVRHKIRRVSYLFVWRASVKRDALLLVIIVVS